MPKLSIARLVDENVLLQWVVPSTNFILQQASDLVAGDWLNIPEIPVLNLTNLQNEVTLSLSVSSNAFFRLKSF